MKSINFDNPYLFLAAVPILIAICVSFAVVFRKDNRSRSSVISLILHIVIVALVATGLAGAVITTVVTETNVYIVADVSYSADKNLDLIDGYIEGIDDKLPRNSKVGAVCFGKEAALLFGLGEERVSVKQSTVDRSATDIAAALKFTDGLFEEDVIKRVVLITDGKQTDEEASSELMNTIEELYLHGVYIDAVYIDSNLGPDDKEIQISAVDYRKNTYLGHESTASVLFRSSYDAEIIAKLYLGDEEIAEKAVTLSQGFNFVDFELKTDGDGVFDYRVTFESETGDTCADNNTYSFTHQVSDNPKILLITSNADDKVRIESLVGAGAEVTAFVNNKKVPCTVEELVVYDEIILSDVDIRELENYTSFIEAVDKAVSAFGKTLLTFGDMKIQNKTDDVLKDLEDMLPVKFGKGDDEPKLFGFVVDISRSMQLNSKLLIAKETMRRLVALLDKDDYIAIIHFSGDATIAQSPIKVSDLDIEAHINTIDPSQGTLIGAGLNVALEHMKNLSFYSKQALLISDGVSFGGEPIKPEIAAADLLANGILVSALNTNSADGEGTMQAVAAAGGGEYYFVNDESRVEDMVVSDMADDIFQSVVDIRTEINVEMDRDATLSGVGYLPAINGYVNSRPKASANTVLTLDYKKPSGAIMKSPLFAWWDYGNGRVSCFTSSLSGSASAEFFALDGMVFAENLMKASIPKERIDYPYSVNLTYNGVTSTVEMIPASIMKDAEADLTLTLPGGEVITESLAFDGSRYFYEFDSAANGKYVVKIDYSYYGKTYSAENYFNVCYAPEYDRFVSFDAASLHEAVRNRGKVSEEGIPTLVNNEEDMDTYDYDLTPALMIAAAALFVADVIIRKLKWRDVASFFTLKRKKF